MEERLLNTKKMLAEIGQEELLRFYDELNEAEKEELLFSIENTDFSVIRDSKEDKSGETIRPIEAVTLKEIEEKRNEFEEAGLKLIREGKAACVLLAGGQGTRLGIDGPKGAYDIGETKNVYIFECLINNLLDVVKKAGAWVPLLIMTSDKNDEETKAFLKEHDYFGYNFDHIRFFVQDMVPSTDFDGKVLLEEKYRVTASPNGNGGWFKSMKSAGLARLCAEFGIEWINVFAVDNILQRMADPVFLGATLLSGKPAGSKVVGKTSPEERVGVMCLRDERPSIVEYYELTDEMRESRDEDGRLSYNWGVILNYVFKFSELIRTEDEELPLHKAKKKIKCVDDKGQHVDPEEPNGYKYETLALDLIQMMPGCLVFEVDRNREFAPVKNAEGSDSPATARALIKALGVEL